MRVTDKLQAAVTTTATKQASPPPPQVSDKVEIFVDGKPVLCDPGITVLQACALAGVEIPR